MFVWLLGLVVRLSMLVERAAPPFSSFEIFFQSSSALITRELPSILSFLSLRYFCRQRRTRATRYHHSISLQDNQFDSLIPILEHELNTSSPFNPIHITYFITYSPLHAYSYMQFLAKSLSLFKYICEEIHCKKTWSTVKGDLYKLYKNTFPVHIIR